MFAPRRRALVIAMVLAAAIAWGQRGDGREERPVAVARYVVEKGDSLWLIARRLAPADDPRAVVQRLIEANRLPSPALQPGQTLVLPGE